MQLQQLTRKVRQEFQVLFGSGLRSPDVNHLFGTRRRYNAAELVNQEIYQVVLSNPVIREQLNRNLPVMREMVLVCGVAVDLLHEYGYVVKVITDSLHEPNGTSIRYLAFAVPN